VDDSVVPKDGRDVQCSNCGQTWFQKSAAQLAEEMQAQPAMPQKHDLTPEPEPVPASETEPAPEPEPTPVHAPTPQKPDETALEVLRQEAAHEAEARQQEARNGLETQPDLGLDISETPAAVSQRTARLRGIEPGLNKHTPRSDLLPDIEEINSSLQADSKKRAPETVSEKKQERSGFRLGFALIIILAAVLFLTYIYAPQITEKLPASERYISSYAEKVDSMRLWLDHLMKTATQKISDDAAGS